MSVIPLRGGIEPRAQSAADQLTAFAADAIRHFSEHADPVTIAIAITGGGRALATSGSTDDSKTIMEVCAVAGALFTNKAAQG